MHGHFLLHFLIWCTVVNYAVLFVWFGIFVFARGWLYRLHGRWFRLSQEEFDRIHYAAMAAYKIGILLFNLVPLIAIHLV